jgi:hypothetical protein
MLPKGGKKVRKMLCEFYKNNQISVVGRYAATDPPNCSPYSNSTCPGSDGLDSQASTNAWFFLLLDTHHTSLETW